MTSVYPTEEFEGLPFYDRLDKQAQFEHQEDFLAELRSDGMKHSLAEHTLQERYRSGKDEFSLPHVNDPERGYHNMVYRVDFADGERWIVKMPLKAIKGDWTDADARQLRAEALTMRFVARKTTIPMPAVFDFCPTRNDALRYPYIIMSHIKGIPLLHVWRDAHPNPLSMRPNKLLDIQRRALGDVARAMVQLNKFKFAAAGSLAFDERGEPCGIEPGRTLDTAKEDFFKNEEVWGDDEFIDIDRRGLSWAGDDAEAPVLEPEHAWTDQPVTKNAMKWYTHPLDQHPPSHPCMKGVCNLLRTLISWLPEDASVPSFVLAHPHLDLRNIIINEQGELQGIIGWDGVSTVPYSLGNHQYPNFLLDEFHPYPDRHGYILTQLNKYRVIWRDAVRLAECSGWRRPLKTISQQENCLPIIASSLNLAARHPAVRIRILDKIMMEMYTVADQVEDPDSDEPEHARLSHKSRYWYWEACIGDWDDRYDDRDWISCERFRARLREPFHDPYYRNGDPPPFPDAQEIADFLLLSRNFDEKTCDPEVLAQLKRAFRTLLTKYI